MLDVQVLNPNWNEGNENYRTMVGSHYHIVHISDDLIYHYMHIELIEIRSSFEKKF